MRHFKKRVQWVYICTNWCMFWNVSMLCHVILSPKWILINLKLCLLKLRSGLVLFLWSSTCELAGLFHFSYISTYSLHRKWPIGRHIYILQIFQKMLKSLLIYLSTFIRSLVFSYNVEQGQVKSQSKDRSHSARKL